MDDIETCWSALEGGFGRVISPAALSLQVVGKSKEFLAKEVKAVARSAFDGLTDPTILILATLIGAGKKININSISY